MRLSPSCGDSRQRFPCAAPLPSLALTALMVVPCAFLWSSGNQKCPDTTLRRDERSSQRLTARTDSHGLFASSTLTSSRWAP